MGDAESEDGGKSLLAEAVRILLLESWFWALVSNDRLQLEFESVIVRKLDL